MSIRDFGNLSPYNHYSSILFSLEQFLRYNRGIIGRLKLSTPLRDQIMENIIRYQFTIQWKLRQDRIQCQD